MADPKDVWINPKEPFCLCIGAGVTASIVGRWSELLRKLTAIRYLTRWKKDAKNDETMLEQGVKEDELAKILKKNPDLQLYPSTAVLEQGEYLLLDGSDASCFIGSPNETRWREQLFMEQVHVLVNRSIGEYISRTCENCTACTACDQCDLCKAEKVKERFNNPDKFPDYYQYVMTLKNTVKDGKEQCTRKMALSTLDAVLRLCLQGDIRQLIVYNFDDIIERLLVSKTVRDIYATNTEVVVNAYSYGGVKEEEKNGVYYHFGMFPLSFSEEFSSPKRTISLYHVHGIVTDGITPIPLVFSEHSYIEYNEVAFNWSNQIIMEILTRFNLLTVGFSGTDSNFRTIAKSLKSAKNSSMFGVSGHNRTIILTLTNNQYTELFENMDEDPQMKGVVIEKLNKYYSDMVDSYYKTYFDVDVWWLKDFACLAQNMLERISSIKSEHS